MERYEAHPIGKQMAELQGKFYAQAPASYSVHMDDELVVVVLEQTFTPAEWVLIEHGDERRSAIRDIRRRFQEIMEEDFKAIVQQATGREVRAFISSTHLEANVAVETFLLGSPIAQMQGFEREMNRPESNQLRGEREERDRRQADDS